MISRTAVIMVKFLIQTSFVSQYLTDGVWKFSGLVDSSLFNNVQVHTKPETDYVPNSFQWLHIVGFFKTDSEYVSE